MSIIIRSIVVLILACSMVGCAETTREEATGKGSIRGFNALADTFEVRFLIEETGLGVIEYKTSSSVSRYDDLTYAFNFDIAISGQEEIQRIATVTQKIQVDTDYLFILAGSLAVPEILLWEHAERAWEGTETVYELAFGHASPALGTVDVYYAPTGTAPVTGAAIGTLSFGERLAEMEFESAEYELTLTVPGDPLMILYQSTPVTNPGGITLIDIFLDADPSITSSVSVRQLTPGGGAAELFDARFPPTVQLLNAAFGTGNVDLVIDSDFANPVISNVPFGTVSADTVVPTETRLYSFTPPNSTTVLYEQDVVARQGTRYLLILQGEVGDIGPTLVTSLRRSLATEALIRFSNASFNAQAIDIYLTTDGALPEDTLPIVSALPFSLATGFERPAAGDYELTITPSGESTILASPLAIQLVVGDVVEFVILDAADPSIVSILEFTNVP